MRKLISILILFTLTLAPYADAAVAVNAIFKDNMVLQREIDIPIWGTAEPGETVTVEYAPQTGFEPAAQKVSAKPADKDGKWMLKLKPLRTSRKGARLIITGDKTEGTSIEIKDVLIGEVWLGSGQSNMAGSTRGYMKNDPALTKAYEGGPYPTLRLYNRGIWSIADKESIKNFSALHFSFGHALNNELDVPVGLMYGATGGTPSGRWLTEDMASSSPSFVEMLKNKGGFTFETMKTKRADQLKEYEEIVKKAKAEGTRPPRFQKLIPFGDLYKRHIQPFAPYAIRGVLWDQGESKTQIPGVDQYTTMNALIKGWRKAWGIGDFPFLHIQKPSGKGCAWDPENPVNLNAVEWVTQPEKTISGNRYCEHNLSHIKIGTIKNAPLVTTSDLAPGIHPKTKYSYGKRACRVALGTVYGKDIATCGPVYKSHKVRFDKIEVTFNNIGKGLAFKHGNKLQGFEIAGNDLKWEWADARIDRLSVIVSNSNIKEPRHVRYAFYKNFNYANLFNKDGLPALMFTTSTR